MPDLGDIIARALTPIIEQMVEHDRRIGATDWRGKVTDVDTEKKLARITVGKDEDGSPVKSPWLPYSQIAGALKIHTPPSVGQVMTIRGSTGDIEQGVLEPFHWSDDNQSPSDKEDEHVGTFGDVNFTLKSGGLTLTVGGSSFEFDGGGFHQTGGAVDHNNHDIGDTHKHTDVTPGGGLTGVPE